MLPALQTYSKPSLVERNLARESVFLPPDTKSRDLSTSPHQNNNTTHGTTQHRAMGQTLARLPLTARNPESDVAEDVSSGGLGQSIQPELSQQEQLAVKALAAEQGETKPPESPIADPASASLSEPAEVRDEASAFVSPSTSASLGDAKVIVEEQEDDAAFEAARMLFRGWYQENFGGLAPAAFVPSSLMSGRVDGSRVDGDGGFLTMRTSPTPDIVERLAEMWNLKPEKREESVDSRVSQVPDIPVAITESIFMSEDEEDYNTRVSSPRAIPDVLGSPEQVRGDSKSRSQERTAREDAVQEGSDFECASPDLASQPNGSLHQESTMQRLRTSLISSLESRLAEMEAGGDLKDAYRSSVTLANLITTYELHEELMWRRASRRKPSYWERSPSHDQRRRSRSPDRGSEHHGRVHPDRLGHLSLERSPSPDKTPVLKSQALCATSSNRIHPNRIRNLNGQAAPSGPSSFKLVHPDRIGRLGRSPSPDRNPGPKSQAPRATSSNCVPVDRMRDSRSRTPRGPLSYHRHPDYARQEYSALQYDEEPRFKGGVSYDIQSPGRAGGYTKEKGSGVWRGGSDGSGQYARREGQRGA
ncbi:uncharacterized protein LY89DRAFT_726597 [Mollisia scopiformis]|uniref:Uncharacterized protein n=1 Tax=Mollisia scopiformis TaxID=149040 RepID=A0A132B203_MOLSC|nr:uncharacterized protein LY89DRAFT_726597 [Mollisia scopiformis]KUJ06412.1 hypothetical protein LY89DRAFT_726597 [Mollisia scopiformis]